MENGFGTTLLRGIFAGWLIALMVWLLPFAEQARRRFPFQALVAIGPRRAEDLLLCQECERVAHTLLSSSPLLIQPSKCGFGVFVVGTVENRDPRVA